MGKLKELYYKYKELILYVVCGVLATVVSFASAWVGKVALEALGAGTDIVSVFSTVFSWVCAVTFAYFTNRRWVFESTAHGFAPVLKEATAFFGGRVFTLLTETAMMWVGVSLLSFDYWWTKIAANVVVLILNYVISKLLVFKKK